MKYSAFRFRNRNELFRTLEHLDKLAEREAGVEYDLVAGSDIVVVPVRLGEFVKGVIESEKFDASSVKASSFNALSPKEQAKRRGQIHRKSA